MTTGAVAEAEIPEFRWIDPKTGELHLNLHDGQTEAIHATERFILVLAGPQGGKTCFGPHWIDKEIHDIFAELRPNERLGDFMAVTSTYDLFNQKMLPELLEVFEQTLGIGKYHTGSKVIELSENLVPIWDGGRFLGKHAKDPNMFGRIILRSADSSSGLESMTAKAAWLDEAGQKEYTLLTWEAVQRRLSIAAGRGRGRVLLTTTIYDPNWLKWEVFDRWAKGDPDYRVIQFPSTMNPAFSRKEFERMRKSMPAWRFRMMYEGEYTKPAGLVYTSFDEEVCVVDRFEIPDNWLWFIGHDFGGVNSVALAFAQNPHSGELYLVYEWHFAGLSVEQQAAILQSRLKGRIIVHRAGGSHQEMGWRKSFTLLHWPIVEPRENAVDVGIQHVFSLHQQNQIKVFRDNQGYLEEKLSYSYQTGQDFSVDDITIVNKKRYHYMDAERYIMGYIKTDAAQGVAPNQVSSNTY